ncbi:unnamed protein product [Adineta ricciae]|uniref:Fas-associated factor 1/2-like UAS domain-containing protein n=1 Tax=Adineta ricciae TaxID=249248 RepID=A0A815AFX6_ADIRI|nr:unnamed protein product [Adineta ricciae]CAF1634868.1 unnamed protein product [Adineta ricciae]
MDSDTEDQVSVFSDSFDDLIDIDEFDGNPNDLTLIFFGQSLTKACEISFGQSLIEERRPILVYIYNEGSILLNESFRKSICYSENIWRYLNMNYIVWPWKFTCETAEILEMIWRNLFSVSFFETFSIEQFPLLIGITRLFEYRTDSTITSEYQFKVLAANNTLVNRNIAVDSDNLFNELHQFREYCDQIEKDLAFNFVETTRLCWDIVYEIAQYLPLNDAISAFSINVLHLLNKSKSFKFQLSNLNDPIIAKILSKIPHDKSVSLYFDGRETVSENCLTRIARLREINSITLSAASKYEDQIEVYKRNFPKLTRLSLYFDNELSYDKFYDLFDLLGPGIQRFEVRCPGISHNYSYAPRSNYWRAEANKIESFLLDLNHHRSAPTNDSVHADAQSFSKEMISWIMKMKSIKYFYFVGDRDDVKQFLHENQWTGIKDACFNLQKISLQVVESIFDDRQVLVQQAQEIQTRLCNGQKTILFRVGFS